MKKNRSSVWLIVMVLCITVMFFTGCAKKAAVRQDSLLSQEQQASVQGSGEAVTEDQTAKEEMSEQERAEQEMAERSVQEQARKEAAEAAERESAARAEAIMEELQIPDVNFDYDKYNLTPEAQEILKAGVPGYLKYKEYKLVVEGHCDERGTVEYNLALGQRRAEEAAKYLVDLGIERERIKTISYGKEMPLDTGHDEAGWAKNRRAHFVALPQSK